MTASQRPVAEVTPDPGSFRDPENQVLVGDETVVRALGPRAWTAWQALKDTRFFRAALADGRVVATEEASDVDLDDGWAGALRHERVPFVSYPYEWAPSMLRDAALLQLDLLRETLEEDWTLKDATPYNVQWFGTRPAFIDVGSFEPLEAGEAWVGYRQFCELFLYPLMLRAYRGVAFQPLMRGHLEGIPVQQMRRLVSARDLLRRGIFLHVILHARADRRYAARAESARTKLRSTGFRKELILANVRRLRKTIERLRVGADSHWSGYAEDYEHVRQDRDAKATFVEGVTAARRRRFVWDLGANDGFFSRIAATHADAVIAFDQDEAVLDRLYRDLVADGPGNVLPLVVDLADPSPGQGWDGRERRTIPERGVPELVLCLAVIHHLVIGRNVPLRRFVAWLEGLGAEVVLEFPSLDDPMVRRLCLNKRPGDIHNDYSEEALRTEVARAFRIAREERLPSGERLLLHLVPLREAQP